MERERIRPCSETRQDLFLSLSDAKNSIFLWHRITPHLEWPATTTLLFAKKHEKIQEKPKSQNQFFGSLRKPTTALTMTAAAGRTGVGGGKTRLHGSSKFTLWGKRVYVEAPVFRIYFMFPRGHGPVAVSQRDQKPAPLPCIPREFAMRKIFEISQISRKNHFVWGGIEGIGEGHSSESLFEAGNSRNAILSILGAGLIAKKSLRSEAASRLPFALT